MYIMFIQCIAKLLFIVHSKMCVYVSIPDYHGKGIMTTVPAWCVSAHASFVFKIDSQKTQYLLIALNKMQLLKKIRLYVEVIF